MTTAYPKSTEVKTDAPSSSTPADPSPFRYRASQSRGWTAIDWLRSAHTFSFNDFHDPQWHHFSHLRVINEDWVQPSQGFMPHHHQDMEIITVVVSGVLQHEDSLGNGSLIRPGEVQRMTAGTGIQHSEMNPSSTEPVHLLQIWIRPAAKDQIPGYEQRAFDKAESENQWQLLASPTAESNSVYVDQDVRLSQARITPGTSLPLVVGESRWAWLQITQGSASILSSTGVSQTLGEGDGLGIQVPDTYTLTASTVSTALPEGAEAEPLHLLWFDLPAV